MYHSLNNYSFGERRIIKNIDASDFEFSKNMLDSTKEGIQQAVAKELKDRSDDLKGHLGNDINALDISPKSASKAEVVALLTIEKGDLAGKENWMPQFYESENPKGEEHLYYAMLQRACNLLIEEKRRGRPTKVDGKLGNSFLNTVRDVQFLYGKDEPKILKAYGEAQFLEGVIALLKENSTNTSIQTAAAEPSTSTTEPVIPKQDKSKAIDISKKTTETATKNMEKLADILRDTFGGSYDSGGLHIAPSDITVKGKVVEIRLDTNSNLNKESGYLAKTTDGKTFDIYKDDEKKDSVETLHWDQVKKIIDPEDIKEEFREKEGADEEKVDLENNKVEAEKILRDLGFEEAKFKKYSDTYSLEGYLDSPEPYHKIFIQINTSGSFAILNNDVEPGKDITSWNNQSKTFTEAYDGISFDQFKSTMEGLKNALEAKISAKENADAVPTLNNKWGNKIKFSKNIQEQKKAEIIKQLNRLSGTADQYEKIGFDKKGNPQSIHYTGESFPIETWQNIKFLNAPNLTEKYAFSKEGVQVKVLKTDKNGDDFYEFVKLQEGEKYWGGKVHEVEKTEAESSVLKGLRKNFALLKSSFTEVKSKNDEIIQSIRVKEGLIQSLNDTLRKQYELLNETDETVEVLTPYQYVPVEPSEDLFVEAKGLSEDELKTKMDALKEELSKIQQLGSELKKVRDNLEFVRKKKQRLVDLKTSNIESLNKK